MVTEKEKDPEKKMSERVAHGCAFAIAVNCGILFMFFGLNYIYSNYSDYLPYATEIIDQAKNADRASVEQTKKEFLIFIPTLLFALIAYASTYYGIITIRKLFVRSE